MMALLNEVQTKKGSGTIVRSTGKVTRPGPGMVRAAVAAMQTLIPLLKPC